MSLIRGLPKHVIYPSASIKTWRATSHLAPDVEARSPVNNDAANVLIDLVDNFDLTPSLRRPAIQRKLSILQIGASDSTTYNPTNKVTMNELDGDNQHEEDNLADVKKKIEVCNLAPRRGRWALGNPAGSRESLKGVLKTVSSGAITPSERIQCKQTAEKPAKQPEILSMHKSAPQAPPSVRLVNPSTSASLSIIALIIDKEPNTSIHWATRYSNRKDVEHDVPKEIRTDIKFVFVTNVGEALEEAFGKYVVGECKKICERINVNFERRGVESWLSSM